MQRIHPSSGAMTSLQMLFLAALLLGASLQHSHAGESQPQVRSVGQKWALSVPTEDTGAGR